MKLLRRFFKKPMAVKTTNEQLAAKIVQRHYEQQRQLRSRLIANHVFETTEGAM